MRRIAGALLLLAVLPAASQEIYDLVLKGGHVIDPKNRRNQQLDIGIISGKIAKIAPAIPAVQSRKVINVADYYVTPGLIDIHASVGPRMTPEGIDPDHNTLRFGVTTVVDAGSSGAANFARFRKEVIDAATVRVLAFLHVSGDAGEAVRLIRQNPQTIVGVYAKTADEAAAWKSAGAAGTIVMSAGLSGAARPGDVVSGIYRLSELQASQAGEARKKGILFDAGGLWFRTAVPAIKRGFLPDTISTGMDSVSLMLPRATMTNVMSAFLAMGLTLEQVIERTTVNPAKAIRRTDLGSLEEGAAADIAVFQLRNGRFGYIDAGHSKLTSDKQLRCVLTIRNGKVVWDTEGLSLNDWESAGPYSNFK